MDWTIDLGDVVSPLLAVAALGLTWRLAKRNSELDERLKVLELEERTSADVRAELELGTTKTFNLTCGTTPERPGSRLLVLRNAGRAPASNVRASVTRIDNGEAFDLEERFPIDALYPGDEERISLDGYYGRNVSVVWSWHDCDEETSLQERARTFK